MKSVKQLLLMLIAIPLFFSCSKEKISDEPLQYLKILDNVDYQVYSVVLKEIFATKEALTIQQTTYKPHFFNFQYLKDEVSDIDSDIFSNYIAKNDTNYLLLDNNLIVESKIITLISPEEMTSLFSTRDLNKNWEEFYNKYPNSSGIIRFTRIGYNEAKNQALVEIEASNASLGAEGLLIYLKKIDDQWKIIQTQLTWAS